MSDLSEQIEADFTAAARAIYEYQSPGFPPPDVPWEEQAAEVREFYEGRFRAGYAAFEVPPDRGIHAPGAVPWQPVNAVCTATGLDPGAAREILETAAPHMHQAGDGADLAGTLRGMIARKQDAIDSAGTARGLGPVWHEATFTAAEILAVLGDTPPDQGERRYG